MWKVLALLLSLLAVAACSSSSGETPQAASVGSYAIAAGDKIRFTVEGEKDFSGEFTVDSAGTVTAPLAGSVSVAGLDLQGAAAAYGAKLREAQILKDPKVTAQAVGARPIFVLGEVNRPGQYAYANGMTLHTAVDMAQGYTYYAKESSAEITRGGRTVEVDVDTEIKILPGDTVRIPRRLF
ncbi:MAG: polysaccharide export protein [Alphaproteobacteria bacterium]|nr:polysaccharide export protein [Alphaproteobacteria bacterium]